MYGLYAFFSIHWFAPLMHSAIACFLYLISEVFQVLVYCIQSGQCCWHCQRSYWSWKSKCSSLNESQGHLFITYLLQCVNYRIRVMQIKVVFSQSKCNQSAPTLKDYYQSELYSISNKWVTPHVVIGQKTLCLFYRIGELLLTSLTVMRNVKRRQTLITAFKTIFKLVLLHPTVL